MNSKVLIIFFCLSIPVAFLGGLGHWAMAPLGQNLENMVCPLHVSTSGQRKFGPPLWNPKNATEVYVRSIAGNEPKEKHLVDIGLYFVMLNELNFISMKRYLSANKWTDVDYHPFHESWVFFPRPPTRYIKSVELEKPSDYGIYEKIYQEHN